MGTALIDLVQALEGDRLPQSLQAPQPYPWNTSVAFSIAAAIAQVPLEAALLGYLHSWLSTLIGAGVKLIPLGQTAGQRLLRELQLQVGATVQESLQRQDDELETQYSRLFRS